jgi:hypothetical protein
MKTATLLSMWMLLGLAACGGSEATEQRHDTAAVTSAAPAATSTQAACTPVNTCDPDRPFFCATADNGCYLLYPNQRTVPVSCIARPAPSRPGVTRRCP